ncbi:MAG: hypothetical protein ACE5FW_00140 [Candidatus Aenigmatarchaeota archaeon]
MIDWFASKVGLLIFAAVCVGALVAFASMQLNIFDQSIRIQSANNLARLVDSVCEGCSTSYSFDRNWSLEIKTNSLVLDGIERQFAAQADPAGLGPCQGIIISKQGGTVHVQKA